MDVQIEFANLNLNKLPGFWNNEKFDKTRSKGQTLLLYFGLSIVR